MKSRVPNLRPREPLAVRLLPPLAVFALVVAVWQLLVMATGAPEYVLPSPGAVTRAMATHAGSLIQAASQTALAAAGGFAASLAVGAVVAFLFSQARWIRRSFYPYAIFLQTVPIVAIAPLILLWVGYGMRSVVIIAFIISLFPIVTNGTTGLTRLDPNLRELFETHNATRWQMLWKLRLPHAVPFFVAGARISAGLSVIGAIVGEFLAGTASRQHGLGYLILLQSQQLRTPELFGTVIACTLLGLAIFGVVTLVGDLLVRVYGDGAND